VKRLASKASDPDPLAGRLLNDPREDSVIKKLLIANRGEIAVRTPSVPTSPISSGRPRWPAT